jgi:DNA-binding NarL/FixJ family response regulator
MHIRKSVTELEPPPPFDHQQWQAILNALGLSPQLCRIVEHVVRGNSNQEISESLGLSEGTVKDYLRRICQKTNTRNRVQLIAHVMILSHQVLKCNHHPPNV